MYLEVSYIGSACGKNRYEPTIKTIMLLLARYSPHVIKKLLFEYGIIIESCYDTKVYDTELKNIYSVFKKNITDVSTVENVKDEIIKKLKSENKEITDEDISVANNFLESSIKKDCGNNNESSVIQSKMYTKGNNFMHRKTPWGHQALEWELRGFHDASHGDTVIEIKTRMKRVNVRKNEYDLYQLFGYLLVMDKTKGKIVQKFQDEIFDSDTENSEEFGIIDISLDKWATKFDKFKQELYSFFEKVDAICDNIEYNIHDYMVDFKNVINSSNDFPIAKIYNGIPRNVNNNYEKLIKTLF